MRVVVRFWCLPLLVVVAGVLPAKEAPEWLEGRSAHFHVISNAEAKQAEQLTNRLEEFRHLMASMFPSLRLDPPVPTTVVFFKNEKSFRPYKPLTPDGKPKNVTGFFQPSRERMYLAMNIGERNRQEITFHEYTHLVMELNLGEVPLWLGEGLAMFYESSQLDGVNFKLGYPQVDSWRLLQQNRLIPLELLLRVDHKSEYYNEARRQALFYGQSWLLVHYLMAADRGQRQKQFADFVNLLQQAVPQETAFTKALGTDTQGMQKQLQDYLRRSNVDYFAGRLTRLPDKQPLAFAALDDALAQAYLADLWINQGRVEEAEQALAHSPASGQTTPEVLYRLGRIALERNQPAQAEQHLSAALAIRPEDIALRYYAAWAVSLGRLSQARDPEGRRAAAHEVVELLLPVLREQGEFPAAHDLLVHARMARDDPPAELIPLLKRARELMPQRYDLAFLLAHCYEREQQWEEAEELLQTVSQQSADPSQRQQAQEGLRRLEATREILSRQRKVFVQTVWESDVDKDKEGPQPVESVPAPAPMAAPKVAYVRGTLVQVECRDDTARISLQPEGRKGESAKALHLVVRSRARLLVLDPTRSGWKLECGTPGVPVAVNYRVEPEGPSIAGVVMTIEVYPPAR